MMRMRDEIFDASLIGVMTKCMVRIEINSWMQLCDQSKYNTVVDFFSKQNFMAFQMTLKLHFNG
jgi:hypothetical protein